VANRPGGNPPKSEPPRSTPFNNPFGSIRLKP
jgi:hypothetical protein